MAEASSNTSVYTSCLLYTSDYLRLLEHWKTAYAPQPQDAIWHPLFGEALQRISYTEYLLDILLYGEIEEKAALIAAQGKEVLRLEPVSYTHLMKQS